MTNPRPPTPQPPAGSIVTRARDAANAQRADEIAARRASDEQKILLHAQQLKRMLWNTLQISVPGTQITGEDGTYGTLATTKVEGVDIALVNRTGEYCLCVFVRYPDTQRPRSFIPFSNLVEFGRAIGLAENIMPINDPLQARSPLVQMTGIQESNQ